MLPCHGTWSGFDSRREDVMTNSKVKTLTVIEREYDSEGNLVKEIETITEYDVDENPYTYPSPTTVPPYKWNPFDNPTARY